MCQVFRRGINLHLHFPNIPGKIIWLSGAPGMGKSTTAQLLARRNGFVYYEADCFMSMKNPYIDLNEENPSVAAASQRTLKGLMVH